jgi:deazaflavin-dependent oxidoreductase (nitroreductase family)
MSDDVNAWNRRIIEEFRANDGVVGGTFEGTTIVLLHTIGAKSGKERTNPLVGLSENGRLFVFASAAGADTSPDWYHNLVANPHVTVELGAERYSATARVLDGPERDEIYAKEAAISPTFAGYQAKTTRVIPVVELVRR